MAREHKKFEYFDGGDNFCLLSFFVFGNYFALFGLPYSSKALKAWNNGDAETALKLRKKSRAWSLWGLIPSTIINVAIIWWCAVFVMEKLAPLTRQILQK